jgi:hypothetical protein
MSVKFKNHAIKFFSTKLSIAVLKKKEENIKNKNQRKKDKNLF